MGFALPTLVQVKATTFIIFRVAHGDALLAKIRQVLDYPIDAKTDIVIHRVIHTIEFCPGRAPIPSCAMEPQEHENNIRGITVRMAKISRLLFSGGVDDHYEALHSLTNILDDTAAKEEIRRCRGAVALQILNFSEAILSKLSSNPLRKRLLRISSSLAEASQQMPSNSVLQDIVWEPHARSGGGYADVRKGVYGQYTVAVKSFRIQLDHHSNWPALDGKICREALTWKHLDHPSLLPFLGVCCIHPEYGFKSIVSPWCERGNISNYLRDGNRLPNIEKSLYQLVSGICYIHSENVIHGDLTGNNILLTDEYDLQICDFGLMKWNETTLLTGGSWAIAGTCRYMAPELFGSEGSEWARPSFASDVYAFACLALEMYTCKIPFFQYKDIIVPTKVLAKERPARPDIPDNLWHLIEMCWSHEPTQRPPMRDVLATMEEWEWHRHLSVSEVQPPRRESSRAHGLSFDGPLLSEVLETSPSNGKISTIVNDNNGAGDVFALVIGIDDYLSPHDLPPLQGAVNDAKAFQQYLLDPYDLRGLQVPPSNIVLLENEQATREGIVSIFKSHFIENESIPDHGEATMIFYFAGHGSHSQGVPAQAPSHNNSVYTAVRYEFIPSLPDELSIVTGEVVDVLSEYDDDWALCKNRRGEQGMVPLECLELDCPHVPTSWDRKFEAICPVDERTTNSAGEYVHTIPVYVLEWLLWELAAKKGPNIIVILDCCHSANGIGRNVGRVRSASRLSESVPPNLDIYLGAPRFYSPILLAACGVTEKAQEVDYEGTYRGRFTVQLIDRLRWAPHSTTYRELTNMIPKWDGQTPHCGGPASNDLLFTSKATRPPRPVTPSQRPAHAKRQSDVSTTSWSGPSNPEHRYLIRSATSMLCEEVVTPPVHMTRTEAGLKDWEEVEVRMRALTKFERTWGENGVRGISVDGAKRERQLFTEALRDGFVLCQLMNTLWPASIVRPDSRDDEFIGTINITKFLAACSSYGLPTEVLFRRDDLNEATSESLARVARTVIALIQCWWLERAIA